MRDLILKRFNKKPCRFEFKSVVNIQISVVLPLCLLKGHLEIPVSPLLLWRAVPLGLPLPPQHVTLRMSAHWDYLTSLFLTSWNTFKSGDASAATMCVQSDWTTCHFSGPHENQNHTSREKNNMAVLQRQHFSCRKRTQKLAQSACIGDSSIKRALSNSWLRARGSLISQRSFLFAARLSFQFSSLKSGREKNQPQTCRVGLVAVLKNIRAPKCLQPRL